MFFNKKQIILLALLSLNMLAREMQAPTTRPQRIHRHLHASRHIMLVNQTAARLIVRYKTPDYGFHGPQVLRNQQMGIRPNESLLITIEKNARGRSPFTIEYRRHRIRGTATQDDATIFIRLTPENLIRIAPVA